MSTILSVDTEQGDSYTTSVVRGFEVTSVSTSVDEMNAFEEVNAFPNPTSGDVQLQFSLGQSRDVTVAVANALGQQVQFIQLGSLPAGEHRTALDLNGLQAGMYNVVIRADDRVKIVRITKQ